MLRDLPKLRNGAVVEMSTSSDPYPPIESWLMLTRLALESILEHNVKHRRGIRVLITTKSNMVVRDLDLLKKLSSAVMITVTTLDEGLAKGLEPHAPSPQARLKAIKELSQAGIPVGVRIDPVIPHINDDPYEIEELIGKVKEQGALHIVTSTYKAKWDSLKRLREAFYDISAKLTNLYVERGVYVHGYRYLPEQLRRSLLYPVVKSAESNGLTIATCRENLGVDFFKAPSCDGSHLIKTKIVW